MFVCFSDRVQHRTSEGPGLQRYIDASLASATDCYATESKKMIRSSNEKQVSAPVDGLLTRSRRPMP